MFFTGLLNQVISSTMIEWCRRSPRSSPLLVALLGLVLLFSSSSTTIPTFLSRFLSPHPSLRRKRKSLTWALVITRIQITKGSLDKGNRLNPQISQGNLLSHRKS